MQINMLIPLANLMTKEIYKMGTLIIKAGEVPTKFSIVASGRANLIYEEKIYRDAKPDSSLLSLATCLKNFNFSKEPKKYSWRRDQNEELEKKLIEKRVIRDDKKRVLQFFF